MKIFLLGEMAFVDINKGYMLCIGTKAEVDKATPQRLIEMIHEARILSTYQSLETTRYTLH